MRICKKEGYNKILEDNKNIKYMECADWHYSSKHKLKKKIIPKFDKGSK